MELVTGLLWTIAVLGILFGVLSWSSPESRAQNEQAQDTPINDNASTEHGMTKERRDDSRGWHKYKKKIEDNEKLITAISTVLLALVTLFLWLATRDLVEDAKHNAQRQLRAYVLYSDNAIELLPDGRTYRVSMSIKNRGLTPAYSVTYWWDAGIFDIETGPLHVYQRPIKETGQISFDLDPTGEWPIKQQPKEISQSDIQAIKNGTKAIYVWGIIKYRDAFPGQHTNFQRCQFANFLIKSGEELASGMSRFDAIEVNNTIEERCIKGENGALKSGFTNTP